MAAEWGDRSAKLEGPRPTPGPRNGAHYPVGSSFSHAGHTWCQGRAWARPPEFSWIFRGGQARQPKIRTREGADLHLSCQTVSSRAKSTGRPSQTRGVSICFQGPSRQIAPGWVSVHSLPAGNTPVAHAQATLSNGDSAGTFGT